LATQRQILFCEETDGGMGHSFHLLYTVDLLQPVRAWESTVLVADNYDSLLNGGVQVQSIDRVAFEEISDGVIEVHVSVHHGGVRLRLEDQEKIERTGWPKPTVRAYRIDFKLEEERFKVTAETAATAKLFGLK